MTEHTELTAELIDRFEAVLSDLGPATRAMGHMVCVAAHAHLGAVGAVAKCCGDFDSLVDSAECRACPARQHYLRTATPSTAQEAMPEEQIREIALSHAQKIAEADSVTDLFVDAIKDAIRAHCLALKGRDENDAD